MCVWYSLCRSHVIDDTRIYAYFIGTCIFYSVILGTPLLCSQYVWRPEEIGGLWLCNISERETGKIEMCSDSQNHYHVTVKPLMIRSLQVK